MKATKRPCLDDGCPVLVASGRCVEHRRRRDRSRGTRQQRGYDAAYDQAHAQWQRRLDAGEQVMCWRCAELGRPHLVDGRPGRWHLGHDLLDRTVIRGPQCSGSNLRDAASPPPLPPP